MLEGDQLVTELDRRRGIENGIKVHKNLTLRNVPAPHSLGRDRPPLYLASQKQELDCTAKSAHLPYLTYPIHTHS